MPDHAPDPLRRNERSRQAILDASIALIGELGYDKVSIEAIARRAGVGKQTIYRWWSSKGAVVLEAATHSLDPVVSFPDTGDFAADLRTQLRGILKLIANTGFGSAYRGLIAAGQSDPELLSALFDQIIEPNVQAFGRRAALAQERGELRDDADVQALRDVVYGFVEYRLIHAMPIKPRHIDALLKIAFDGVR
ncbi:TetR/AcrR family transcriptional regulator [Solirubrobacter sp. CPCC 204708]|uniref:TetR/AcrR family transcriptional regulator n=1 Tax=Solirubrobacter deserti TaxID=2282478 RepID=A0ABT4RUL5_9ACTN|nr:TetR/AcrR family transcriptional regulator [Solirubrobacter deserti]MBE2320970.1 TetR/AcrR family transcriptional regulator [Solirubrobacter deserti]MDA0142264.1 TetR/AcrR family transcriptional regulator [Solirubrobacter deserti]